jgi:hypothetical protein
LSLMRPLSLSAYHSCTIWIWEGATLVSGPKNVERFVELLQT